MVRSQRKSAAAANSSSDDDQRYGQDPVQEDENKLRKKNRETRLISKMVMQDGSCKQERLGYGYAIRSKHLCNVNGVAQSCLPVIQAR